MQNARVRLSHPSDYYDRTAAALPLSVRHYSPLSLSLPPPLPPPPPLPFPPPSPSPRAEAEELCLPPTPVKFVAPTGSHVPINGVLLLVGRAGNNPLARFSVSPSRATPASTPVVSYPSFSYLPLRAFSPFFLPRAPRPAAACSRRVDPIREGELFL